jgi:transposase
MKATTIGIDLAKNVIQVHGVDERGDTIVRKQLKRDQMLQFFGNLTACRIGMEACGSAHYWARKLEKLGHVVKLIFINDLCYFYSGLDNRARHD